MTSTYEIDEPVLYSHSNSPRSWGRVIGIEHSNGSMLLKFIDASGCVLAEATSDISFFKAFIAMRLILERMNLILYCRGCEEDVYPSPMQESMGTPLLAYKNVLGRQALNSDIVNIWECNDSTTPATVEQQQAFHNKWLESL